MSEETKRNVVGEDSAGGITSSYAVSGLTWKVPYSFFGSIYDEAEEKQVLEAMRQDSLTMGPKVLEFERRFAAMTGTKHAFATSNCTTAMHVAAQAMGLRPGDEVIVTPNTFVATSLVILKEGATPVYADIDPKTFNIDPKEVEKKSQAVPRRSLSSITAARWSIWTPSWRSPESTICLSLRTAPMRRARNTRAERPAQSAISAVFLHSLKNITTLGEGGMITTNNDDYVEKITMLRCMNNKDWTNQSEYWLPSHFDNDTVDGKWGSNYRMNECQAGVGIAQLDKLEMLNERRIYNGRYITEGISGIRGVTPVYEDPNCKHIYHLYTVCIEEKELGASRDDFMRVMTREEGIQGILHYQPTYDFTSLKRMGYPAHICPKAEEFFYRREFNIPMHPRLTKDDLDAIVAGIRNTAKKVGK